MRHRSLPADRRLGGSLIRRLDRAAAWVNPFLVAIATLLLVADLSYGVALLIARLPITHISHVSMRSFVDPPELLAASAVIGLPQS